MNTASYAKISSKIPSDFGRVAVLMGGTSSERDISLQSGAAVLKGLIEEGIDAFPLVVGDSPVQQLLDEKMDRAFIALHGPGGEDGKIQAVLSFLNIPYTGSGIAASSLAMDKLKTKQIWQGIGLPTPNFEVLRTNIVNVVEDDRSPYASGATTDYQKILANLGGACFVKPVAEGSSLGMRLVDTVEDLISAHEYASSFKSDVIAEAQIVGREFTVSILNGVALPIIELKTQRQFYDFDAKYLSDDTSYLCPASLPEAQIHEINQLALAAFSALSCTSWGRVDVMQDQAGKFYLLEVNTVPGMTSHSLVPMSAKAAGLSFNQLLVEILSGSFN